MIWANFLFKRILKGTAIVITNISPYGEAMRTNGPLRQSLMYIVIGQAEELKSLSAPKSSTGRRLRKQKILREGEEREGLLI